MTGKHTAALTRFEQALETLEAACLTASNDLERDGTIQRFEFTFELAWKCLSAVLAHEGYMSTHGPRTCIKDGARHGYLQTPEDFLDMLEDRNLTAHVYKAALAEEIFQRIKNRWTPYLRELLEALKRPAGTG